jgi:hypothetical protein
LIYRRLIFAVADCAHKALVYAETREVALDRHGTVLTE